MEAMVKEIHYSLTGVKDSIGTFKSWLNAIPEGRRLVYFLGGEISI
jgi:hypothetical protein